MSRADEQYRQIIRDRINELNSKIRKLELGQGSAFENSEIKIRGYKLEIERLQQELNENEDREKLANFVEKGLSHIDTKYEGNIDKQKQIRLEIEKLEEIKKNLKTRGARRIASKRIERRELKIAKLKNANIRRDKIQKAIMYPKYRIDMIKKARVSKAQGRVNFYKDSVSDNNELKKMLNENSIIDNIKGMAYDIKGRWYQCKLIKAEDTLKKMQNKNCVNKKSGARVATVVKDKVEEFRQFRNQKHNQVAGYIPAIVVT